LKLTKNKGIFPNEQQLSSIAASTQFSILLTINDAKFHAYVRLIILTTNVLATYPNALLIIIIHGALIYAALINFDAIISIIPIILIAIIPNFIAINVIYASII